MSELLVRQATRRPNQNAEIYETPFQASQARHFVVRPDEDEDGIYESVDTRQQM